MLIILILISSLTVTCETIIEADEISWTSPNSLENRRGWVAAGLILINIKRNRESWAGLRENFVFMIDSLLSHTPNTNIHFIIITDEWTRNDAASLLSSSVSQFLSMNIIAKEDYHARKRRKNLKLGRYRASYVNINSLVSGEDELLSVFKANTDLDILNSPGNMKYFSTLFYIAPLYHKKFSELSRLVLLDTDLMFQSSIRDLWRQFLAFSPGQCIGLAPDLSPHYWHRLETLRGQRPDTDLGRPGPGYQGFNSGVALYDLSCLRDSREYNEQLKPEQVSTLVSEYDMKITLGDQDWFTMLGWKIPSLFYNLPCQFNLQTSLQYLAKYKLENKTELAREFHKYNYCVPRHNAKIMHSNGCGPKIEHCL